MVGELVVAFGGRRRDLKALAQRLEAHAGISLTENSTSGSLVSFADRVGAAVVVFDGFPSNRDLREINDAVERRHDLGVVVIGPLAPRLDVLIALASGVSGYVPEPGAPAAVAQAIETVVRGGTSLPPEVSGALVEQLQAGGPVVHGADGQPVKITSREWEILVLVRQGRSTAEIAERLVIATVTVRSHVFGLVRKLGLADRSDLATSWFRVPAKGGPRDVGP
jgi:DNA-binding NarL/FixJ family response regulator